MTLEMYWAIAACFSFFAWGFCAGSYVQFCLFRKWGGSLKPDDTYLPKNWDEFWEAWGYKKPDSYEPPVLKK